MFALMLALTRIADSGQSSADSDTTRLWRVKRTILQLCRDRVRERPRTSLLHSQLRRIFLVQGYEISEQEIATSLDDFRAKYGEGETVESVASSWVATYHWLTWRDLSTVRPLSTSLLQKQKTQTRKSIFSFRMKVLWVSRLCAGPFCL